MRLDGEDVHGAEGRVTFGTMAANPLCTADIIRRWGSETPDATAMVFEGNLTTWAQLDQRSSMAANALAATGVGNQERVVFLDKNGPTYFEVAFGVAKINAVLVAANWRLAPPELVYTINDATAKVVIVGPDFIPVIEQIAAELTTVTKIVVIGLARAVAPASPRAGRQRPPRLRPQAVAPATERRSRAAACPAVPPTCPGA